MDTAVTLGILAIFGVLSILLFAIRGFLDQLPDVFASAYRVRRAWRELRGPGIEVESRREELPVHAQRDSERMGP
ncbi:hypothetical protein ACF087_02355 [Streptomyces goshikiensis]|uniref:hypothetical protein n=1 Tax=Streptomyces goshikiensis TaxID=1942 RepID=UPI0036F823C1